MFGQDRPVYLSVVNKIVALALLRPLMTFLCVVGIFTFPIPLMAFFGLLWLIMTVYLLLLLRRSLLDIFSVLSKCIDKPPSS